MNASQDLFGRSQWRFFLLLIAVGLLLGASAAEALLAPKAIRGIVQLRSAGEQSWRSMTAADSLRAGDLLQSAPESSVELWFEDGSMFWMGPNSKLAIDKLQVSSAAQSRTVRLDLIWGTVSAKITRLEFNTSVCEIRTDMVTVGLKFSDATVTKDKDGFAPDRVELRQGAADIQQTGAGTLEIAARIDQEEGLNITSDASGARIDLTVQNLLRKVTLSANLPLGTISALIGAQDNFLKIDNNGTETIHAASGVNTALIGPASHAAVGIPAPETLRVKNVINASFSFQRRDDLGMACIVFNKQGQVSLNGNEIAVGKFQSATLAGRDKLPSRDLTQQASPASTILLKKAEEALQAPPSAGEPSSTQGGSPALPTPLVPMPTVTSTPRPDKTPPEVTATPMPTVTPRPTMKPRPPQTPSSPVRP